MKILVGILHTIENEFEQCISAIKAQTHQDLEYFVIENLPNKKAHDTLYRTFMDKSDEVDFYVKVDADMIIEDRHLLEKVVQKFNEDEHIKHIKVPVHDYFTGEHTIGMHFFRSNVIWETGTDEQVFVDEHPVNVSDENVQVLESFRNRVSHCANPSPFQSFHFGMHRGVKVIQGILARNSKKRWNQAGGHLENVHKLLWNYLKSRDKNILLALSGTSLAISGRLKKEHISYSNPFAKKVFDNIISQTSDTKLFFNSLSSLILLYIKKPIFLGVYAYNKLDKSYSLLKRYKDRLTFGY
jgi:hypothetical protein